MTCPTRAVSRSPCTVTRCWTGMETEIQIPFRLQCNLFSSPFLHPESTSPLYPACLNSVDLRQAANHPLGYMANSCTLSLPDEWQTERQPQSLPIKLVVQLSRSGHHALWCWLLCSSLEVSPSLVVRYYSYPPVLHYKPFQTPLSTIYTSCALEH